MKRIIFSVLTLALAAGSAFEALAWGRDVHAGIAYIAECNLTPRAKANIEKCIDGHSIVYYASWLDNHRKEYKKWDKRAHIHSFNLGTQQPIGKAVKQLHESIDLLSHYEDLNDSVRKVNIYFLVHTVGDYHCPGHANLYAEDGKTAVHKSFYPVRYMDNKKPQNYHLVWDSAIFSANHANWSYMDFATNLDEGLSKEQKDKMIEGTIEDWLADCARQSLVAYERAPKVAKDAPFEQLSHIDRNMANDFGVIADEQIEKAGLRLAKILNDLFDK